MALSVYYGTMIMESHAERPPKFLRYPLIAGILAYLALFAAFYPPIAGIEDEQGFVNQAIFWYHGGLSAEAAGLPVTLGDLVEVDGRHLPARHPGRSLVALPFYAVGGYAGVFASGAFLHVVLTLLAAATFRRLGISPWWALGVLFHPTLLIYSRTVMGDASAGLGLLVSVWALAALFLALAGVSRMSEIPVPVFDPAARSKSIDHDVSNMTPLAAWQVWVNNYRTLSHTGFEVFKHPMNDSMQITLDWHRAIQKTLMSLAAA